LTLDRPSSTPAALLWLLAFAAVLSHLTAVGFDFAQDDFVSLARAMGSDTVPDASARFWTTTATWSIFAPLFGSDPAPYHGVALMLLAGVVVFAARITSRLTQTSTTASAATAGLLILLGPTTSLPVAWVSASNELWAALFALVALDRWLVPGGARTNVVAAVVAAILSLHSKESALLLGPVFFLAGRWLLRAESTGSRRTRLVLSLVVTLAAVHAAQRVFVTFRPDGDGAYAFADAGKIVVHFTQIVAWAVSPLPLALDVTGISTGLGALVLAAGIVHAKRAALVGDDVPMLLLILGCGAALPAAAIGRGPEPYHALLPSVIAAVWLGRILGPRLDAWFTAPSTRRIVVAGVAVAVTVFMAFGIDVRLRARGDDGQLRHPELRRTTVANAVRSQLSSLATARPQPTAIGVLQASRLDLEDASSETGEAFFVGSPVYMALAGQAGLDVLSRGGPEARWVTHVDDVPDGGFVFLDPGDAVLRPLGPPSNARLYAALIGVAAGQFQRARHDLWSAIADQGVQVRFAFDPAHLPITPEELDAEAAAFVTYLRDSLGADGTTTNLRVLRLFEQLYETVRGKELVRDLDDLAPERARRFDR